MKTEELTNYNRPANFGLVAGCFVIFFSSFFSFLFNICDLDKHLNGVRFGKYINAVSVLKDKSKVRGDF